MITMYLSYWLLLGISVLCVLVQLMVRDKQPVHLFFAVFCGSIAMLAANKLSLPLHSDLGYWFSLGACATCNGYWLVARCLFRREHAVLPAHIGLSVIVAMCILADKALFQFDEYVIGTSSVNATLGAVIGEILILLSSCMIALTVWEGIRNWQSLDTGEKKQRILYLLAVVTAIFSATVIGGAAKAMGLGSALQTSLIPFAATSVIIVTQILIVRRYPERTKLSGYTLKQTQHHTMDSTIAPIDQAKETLGLASGENNDSQLTHQLETLLVEKQWFLQPQLKVSDVARQLDVSEYRISRALRDHGKETNFNRLVNQLRVNYAMELLESDQAAKWSVLVIGLESGFSSVGTFTRAFKSIAGITPGAYRKNYQSAC